MGLAEALAEHYVAAQASLRDIERDILDVNKRRGELARLHKALLAATNCDCVEGWLFVMLDIPRPSSYHIEGVGGALLDLFLPVTLIPRAVLEERAANVAEAGAVGGSSHWFDSTSLEDKLQKEFYETMLVAHFGDCPPTECPVALTEKVRDVFKKFKDILSGNLASPKGSGLSNLLERLASLPNYLEQMSAIRSPGPVIHSFQGKKCIWFEVEKAIGQDMQRGGYDLPGASGGFFSVRFYKRIKYVLRWVFCFYRLTAVPPGGPITPGDPNPGGPGGGPTTPPDPNPSGPITPSDPTPQRPTTPTDPKPPGPSTPKGGGSDSGGTGKVTQGGTYVPSGRTPSDFN